MAIAREVVLITVRLAAALLSHLGRLLYSPHRRHHAVRPRLFRHRSRPLLRLPCKWQHKPAEDQREYTLVISTMMMMMMMMMGDGGKGRNEHA